MWLHERGLSRALQQFAGDFAVLSLLIAGVTGGLVYLAVLLLLVRPMRRITGSIAAFRADPERTTPLDPSDVTVLANDEISVAGQELAAMQHELRAALWRNARLAALGTVVAKVSHDLRGILTPALLTAERLQLNADPRVQRAGRDPGAGRRTGGRSGAAHVGLCARRSAAARLRPGRVGAAGERGGGDGAASLGAPCGCTTCVDPAIVVRADRIQLFRVLSNLMRNAAEAGARSVRVSAHHDNPTLAIEISDDGPGLPEPVRSRPVPPVCRQHPARRHRARPGDRPRSDGGAWRRHRTGGRRAPSGTTFRLTLPPGGAGAGSRSRAEWSAHCPRHVGRRIGRAREGEHVSIGEWLVLALACAAGVVGLLLAASGDERTLYVLGLGLFAGAVIYAALFIKRHFDRLDRTQH